MLEERFYDFVDQISLYLDVAADRYGGNRKF